jgi:hypothetical protein
VSAALAVVVTVAVVVSLVVTAGPDDTGETDGARTSRSTPPAPTPAAPLSTPLAELDTTALTVQRAEFCDLVPAATVEAVVGGTPGDVETYGNGESAPLAPEVTDVAHEHGCRWQRGRTTARAWVFAPPLTSRDAQRVLATTRDAEGCDVRRGAPAYGEPSLARTCEVGRGRTVEASYRGLFGDAWLSCSLTTPGEPDAVLERAGAWCAEVAVAAAQPAG